MSIRKSVKKLGILSGMCIIFLFGCGRENDNNVINETAKEKEADGDSEVNEAQEAEGESSVENVILEEIREEGSRMDSFYQESLLLEYDFYMPQTEGLTEQAAGEIAQWRENEFDLFMREVEERVLSADSDFLERQAETDEELRGWGVPGSYSVGYAVFQGEGLVSFLRTEYQYYSGAAHGNTAYTGVVFDSHTGEELTLDYFLDGEENGRVAFAQYLIEQLNGEELWADYAESIMYKIVFDPQFYVEDGSLIFLFDAYELASYAQGPFFLEVPLETKRVLKDKTAVEKWIQELQIPGEVNHYLVEIPAGQIAEVDLDGDGLEEELLYPAKESFGEDNAREIDIMIGGEEFQLTVDDNIIRESIGLADIDSGDGKYELAIRATGASDDYVTAFYRYDSGEIKEVGRVGCVIGRNSTNTWQAYLNGDGSIYGDRVLGILEIRQVDARWDLDPETDTLQLYEKTEYNYFSDNWLEPFVGWRGEHPYVLTGKMLVYEQMDRTSEHQVITGEDTRLIQFLSTDGKNWVEAEFFTDGEFKRGWLHVKDDIYIEVDEDQYAPCFECIENLQGAG